MHVPAVGHHGDSFAEKKYTQVIGNDKHCRADELATTGRIIVRE
jgi:hypothetical protein